MTLARDRDGTRSAETVCPAPVLKDCQARAEGIARFPRIEPPIHLNPQAWPPQAREEIEAIYEGRIP